MTGSAKRGAISELAETLGISQDLIHRALWMLKMKSAYRVWTIPKKPSGERQIQVARWPLNEIQVRIAGKIYPYVSEISHSFVAGRSHRTAVFPHLRANAFFTFDIKDAFPSTRKKQVAANFRWIGFKKAVADLMADLICYSPTEKSEEGFLPQGYASSPTVFNLILKTTDRVLFGFSQKRGYQVTRYVDNFAISTTQKTIPEEERRLAIKIVESLSLGNFKIPEEKTSYREAGEKEVHFEFLGLVIEGPRDGERKIGLTDEKLADYALAIQKAMETEDFSERKFREVRGKINYLKSVYQGRALPSQVAELYKQYRLLREIINATRRGQLSFPI